MSPEQFADIVKRVTYKKNVTFKFIHERNFMSNQIDCYLRVRMEVEDVHTGRMNFVQSFSTVSVHLYRTEDEVLRFLYESVIALETHEVKEWFKIDGKPYIDPHPEENERNYAELKKGAEAHANR